MIKEADCLIVNQTYSIQYTEYCHTVMWHSTLLDFMSVSSERLKCYHSSIMIQLVKGSQPVINYMNCDK